MSRPVPEDNLYIFTNRRPLMLLLQTGIALPQRMILLKCLHSEWGVWLSCNACKLANPPAWLQSEQQAAVSICPKYAELCKNIGEKKHGRSGQPEQFSCCYRMVAKRAELPKNSCLILYSEGHFLTKGYHIQNKSWLLILHYLKGFG